MKTEKQIEAYAQVVAQDFVYSDADKGIAWEPFENWDADDLAEQIEMMADTIKHAMLWAQKGEEK